MDHRAGSQKIDHSLLEPIDIAQHRPQLALEYPGLVFGAVVAAMGPAQPVEHLR